ncbi:anhydro-N-acetylmuramic acid kinase [Mariprofundus ferrinatatus]|uniref:Anhydro-N-acetylmuramic acid kinase n=1 Tax=Mariprofundus ferrinatatus TaxID=1921087 RepID=A0A2K8L661_9PROT|nr:anhydro-N-acetylmuramic acid kinase [Mariprofundus ferrinatatus]ATX82733.1 anhydro-N-acetylmuramic acid kinase [Mariprofundus ferrinatatus]
MRTDHQLFIGIMSGTSADGIDIAIARMDHLPGSRMELIQFSEYPMPEKLREPILRLAAPGLNEIERMGELDRALGHAYADTVLAALHGVGLKPADIAVIGLHGQTIRHHPRAEYPYTVQIGCAATVAERTGITTVSDFRSRDIAAGGEGAPLVPFSHHHLFAHERKNIAVVNIGGIANVTWLGLDGTMIGFDTGPGNMIMDGLMLTISEGRSAFDHNGELAASGTVCDPLLEKLMQHPFLQRKPPKSTGREEFGEDIVNLILGWPDISDADRMATACQFTADSIENSLNYMPVEPARWLVCGGGVRNGHLMSLLKRQLAPARVTTTDVEDIPPQAVEALCFAILARQTLMGEPNTLCEVTGAAHAVCGGQITPGKNWQELLQAIPAWIR